MKRLMWVALAGAFGVGASNIAAAETAPCGDLAACQSGSNATPSGGSVYRQGSAKDVIDGKSVLGTLDNSAKKAADTVTNASKLGEKFNSSFRNADGTWNTDKLASAGWKVVKVGTAIAGASGNEKAMRVYAGMDSYDKLTSLPTNPADWAAKDVVRGMGGVAEAYGAYKGGGTAAKTVVFGMATDKIADQMAEKSAAEIKAKQTGTSSAVVSGDKGSQPVGSAVVATTSPTKRPSADDQIYLDDKGEYHLKNPSQVASSSTSPGASGDCPPGFRCTSGAVPSTGSYPDSDYNNDVTYGKSDSDGSARYVAGDGQPARRPENPETGRDYLTTVSKSGLYDKQSTKTAKSSLDKLNADTGKGDDNGGYESAYTPPPLSSSLVQTKQPAKSGLTTASNGDNPSNDYVSMQTAPKSVRMINTTPDMVKNATSSTSTTAPIAASCFTPGADASKCYLNGSEQKKMEAPVKFVGKTFSPTCFLKDSAKDCF